MRWIIGDIHGMLVPLRILLDRIREEDPDAAVFCAGDYVNRGPDSAGVIELLRQDKQIRCVRGNHDDLFQLFLTGTMWSPQPEVPDALATLASFALYGVQGTYTSYGLPPAAVAHVLRRPTGEGLAKLNESVPPEHREFLANLPGIVADDDLFVIHAHWKPRKVLPPPDLRRQSMLWQRFEIFEIDQPKRWGKTGYFGHTPTLTYGIEDNVPIKGEQMYLLDTGCCMPDGRLSAVCHETGRLLQVHRTGEVLA